VLTNALRHVEKKNRRAAVANCASRRNPAQPPKCSATIELPMMNVAAGSPKQATFMPDREFVDFYEVLQVSPSAEPETIHRVYRLLAQRWHPDNQETGDIAKFRAVHSAYVALSDPEKRAQYDVHHVAERQTRWRIASTASRSADNFERAQIIRLTVLEILYMQRLTESNAPGIFLLDLEQLLGEAREHVEFTLWYLQQKQLVQRTENSRLAITATGVDYLEAEYKGTAHQRRLPSAATAGG
jgi:DnaJ-like protein